MTEEEKRDIVQEVLKAIKAQSQDIMSLPSSENVSEFKSLPVVATDGNEVFYGRKACALLLLQHLIFWDNGNSNTW